MSEQRNPTRGIPADFTIREMVDEVQTTHSEKATFLETKLRKGAMSEEMANLARYRLARLYALQKFLRSLPQDMMTNGETAEPRKPRMAEPEPEPEMDTVGRDPVPQSAPEPEFDPFAVVDDF